MFCSLLTCCACNSCAGLGLLFSDFVSPDVFLLGVPFCCYVARLVICAGSFVELVFWVLDCG